MVEQATNGFTVTISGENAILSQRQDGEAVPVYRETPEGGRTSVGDTDSQLVLGRELAAMQETSLGIVYSDKIREVGTFREATTRDLDGEMIIWALDTFANPDQIPSF